MASRKSDLRFKYVNTIPANVDEGTFYWKYENGVNQLYFSPTNDREKILRLDNIISGQGDSIIGVSSNVSLVSIYQAPDEQEQVIIDQNAGTVSAWSDDDWENYVTSLTETEKYGNISERPFSRGNVVICGNREFICKDAKPVCSKITIDGVDYFKKRGTENEPCVDTDNVKIPFDATAEIVPDDTEVTGYDRLSWECFGDNLSKDLADKIANFTMSITGDRTINVVEGEIGGYPAYTLSVVIKENNPLTATMDTMGTKKVVISESNSDDPTGGMTLMSAGQIRDIINDVINIQWIERDSI